MQNFLKIGSGVPELEDPEKWHFPLKAFIALTTVLRYRADCDVHEMPRLRLFESFILPLLTYGCDGLLFPRVYVHNVCWNNVYRKVFNMRMWDSVKESQIL